MPVRLALYTLDHVQIFAAQTLFNIFVRKGYTQLHNTKNTEQKP